ncbi:aconitase family protein [Boseaceae bacterium BT-24-1]|nr:aconitase family protein [Boseaceae bacterium BT-24-1]
MLFLKEMKEQAWLSDLDETEWQPTSCSCRPSRDEITISAINRNFPGRSGPGKVWLASPATVATSAIAGENISAEALLRLYFLCEKFRASPTSRK